MSNRLTEKDDSRQTRGWVGFSAHVGRIRGQSARKQPKNQDGRWKTLSRQALGTGGGRNRILISLRRQGMTPFQMPRIRSPPCTRGNGPDPALSGRRSLQNVRLPLDSANRFGRMADSGGQWESSVCVIHNLAGSPGGVPNRAWLGGNAHLYLRRESRHVRFPAFSTMYW